MIGLTDDEHKAVSLAGQLYNLISQKVILGGSNHEGDVRELCAKIHDIQNMVLAQAAARAHPDLYRLMGASFGDKDE